MRIGHIHILVAIIIIIGGALAWPAIWACLQRHARQNR